VYREEFEIQLTIYAEEYAIDRINSIQGEYIRYRIHYGQMNK
jgi:hypothetical protein